MVLPVALGAAGLREPVIHADSAAGGDPLHEAVEYLSAALVFIESEMTEVVQESSRLRRDFGIDVGDVVGQRVGTANGVGRRVLQPGVPVANGRETETRYRWILASVRKRIDVGGGEPRCCPGQGWCLRVRVPVLSRNCHRDAVHVVPPRLGGSYITFP